MRVYNGTTKRPPLILKIKSPVSVKDVGVGNKNPRMVTFVFCVQQWRFRPRERTKDMHTHPTRGENKEGVMHTSYKFLVMHGDTERKGRNGNPINLATTHKV